MKNSKVQLENWYTFIRIDNSTLLRMYLRDGHLSDGMMIEDRKPEFERIVNDYCMGELNGVDELIDRSILEFARFFLGIRKGTTPELDRAIGDFIRHERMRVTPVNRGHVKHSLGCVLLSHFLLEFDADCRLLKRPPPETRDMYPKGEILPKHLETANYQHVTFFLDPFMWLLFFHDCGYPYELSPDPSFLPELPDVKALKEVLETSFMGAKKGPDWVNNLFKVIRGQYTTSRRDHGVSSSLFLLKTLKDEIDDYPIKDERIVLKDKLDGDRSELKQLKKKYFYEALSAIAMHNLDLGNLGYKINILDNVYYFLLKLFDEIVDWSRPVADIFWRGVEPLDHILLNVLPKKDDEKAMQMQVIVNFKDNRHLLDAAELYGEEFDQGGRLFEVNQFERKRNQLEALDFCYPDGDKKKWLDLEIVLIDRDGGVYVLAVPNNKPSFSEVLKGVTPDYGS